MKYINLTYFLFLYFLTIYSTLNISGQAVKTAAKDTTGIQQIDVVDIFQLLLLKELRIDSAEMKDNGPFFSPHSGLLVIRCIPD